LYIENIRYKADHVAALQKGMDTAVTNNDRVAVFTAVKHMDIAMKEDDSAWGGEGRTSSSAHKCAHKVKSSTGTIAREDAEAEEEYTRE
jgi:hypothetical protein